MTALWLLVGLVVVQRLGELACARRNERQLLAEGGVEHGAGHYPLIVGLHVAWLASLLLQVPPETPVRWPYLMAFLVVQGGRAWVMASLGRRWTTRVIVVPGRPPVRSGPYRFLKHPNYLVVAAEIALLPLAFGAWRIAVVYSALNAALLMHRIRVENRALAEASAAAPGSRG